MPDVNLTLTVRQLPGSVAVIDIEGEVTGFADDAFTAAYNQASNGHNQAVVLNFDGLEYMNSSGIGLLVTILIRAQRQKQRLLAYGLNDHYQQIFSLTRLNEAIGIFPDEATALAAVQAPAR